MSDQITVNFTKAEAKAVEAILRDVELLTDNTLVQEIPFLQKATEQMESARILLTMKLDELAQATNYTVEFKSNVAAGNWKWVSDRKRFWERRRFTKQQAEAFVAQAKLDGPSFFEYRILPF